MNPARFFSEHRDLHIDGLPFDRKQFPAHGGVYALTGADGSVIQLSSGENLRQTIASRLDPATDQGKRPRADLLQISERVWWEPSHSRFETSLKFLEIAYHLFPGKYRKMCAFGPAWFAAISMGDTFPRWSTTSDPFTGQSVSAGPFATRKKCEPLVHEIEDLFSLCRYHDILVQTPQGEACTYFEMGRCPAPCDGTIPFARYRGMLDDSIAFATGNGAALLGKFEQAMSIASQKLDFEEAGRYKEAIERAKKLAGAFRRVRHNVAEFRYLIVQRGGGRTKVKPFFVNQGEIRSGQAVRIAELDQALPEWTSQLEQSAEPDMPDLVLATERMWLVCHFLLKYSHTPGLYLHYAEVPNPATLARRIVRAFAPQAKAGPPGP